MTQLLYGLLAVSGGTLAGVIFFGGLWWTVQQLQYVRRPLLLVLGSLAVRIITTMIIFYGVMAITENLLYLMTALISFILVRIVLTNRVRPLPNGNERNRHATES